MAERRTDYFIQTAALDQYIHLPNPQSDPVARRVVIKRLKESRDLYQYFFAQGPTPGWAEILLADGLFDDPPSVILEGSGFRTPTWPPSAYLAAVASYVPQVVSTLVGQINTDNPTVHTDLVSALASIPTEDALKHIGKVEQWLGGKFVVSWWGLPEAVTRFASILSEKGRTREALDLINEILRPVVLPISRSGDLSMGAVAKSRFELDHLRPDLWQDVLPGLEAKAPLDVTELLDRNLLLAIRLELEAEGRGNELVSWRSYQWRSSVGDSSQDHNVYYKDRLLVALRDSILRLVDRFPSEGRSVVESYTNSDVPIRRRIGIYILAARSAAYLDLIASLLLDRKLHQETGIHNEYFALLEHGFPLLPSDVRAHVEQVILAGPDPDDTKRLATWAAAQYKVDAGHYATQHKDTWIRDRLWVIRSNLGQETREYLNRLRDEYKEPQHPEFLAWSSGAFFVSDQSPFSIDTLAALPSGQLAILITHWQPKPDQQFGPVQITTQGLATNVATVVLANDAKYGSIVPDIASAASAYASAIFAAAEEAWRQKSEIAWPFLFGLAREVLARRSGNQQGADSNFETGFRLLNLIESALDPKRPLPSDYFSELEGMLLVLLNDPNPTPKDDDPADGWLGNGDPATLAVNAIRPKALICIMELLGLRLHLAELDAADKPSSWEDLLTTQLRDSFHSRLDKSIDPSWSVHSIFGRYIWLLDSISFKWLEENLHKIFPPGDDAASQKYFVAAWDSYLIFNRPSRRLLDTLRPDYARAILFMVEGKVTKTHLDPQSGLAYHLWMDYLWRPYDLTIADGRNLLGLLYSKCDRQVRGRATWILWQLVKGIPNNELEQLWPSIRAVWQWRTNEASLQDYSIEFDQEIEWFARLPALAPKSETIEKMQALLESLLPYVRVWNIWQALEEFLAIRVSRAPQPVIRYYRLMHERETVMQYGYPASQDESFLILRTALEDPSAKRDAIAVLNMAGRRTGGRAGRYKELYEQYAS